VVLLVSDFVDRSANRSLQGFPSTVSGVTQAALSPVWPTAVTGVDRAASGMSNGTNSSATSDQRFHDRLSVATRIVNERVVRIHQGHEQWMHRQMTKGSGDEYARDLLV